MKWVKYHSDLWMQLVEQGWVTMFTEFFNEERYALMLLKETIPYAA